MAKAQKMNEKIIIEVSPSGETEVKVVGHVAPAGKLTENIENALGKRISDIKTHEYNEREVNEVRNATSVSTIGHVRAIYSDAGPAAQRGPSVDQPSIACRAMRRRLDCRSIASERPHAWPIPVGISSTASRNRMAGGKHHMSDAKDCIPKKAIAEVLVLRQQDCQDDD